MIELHCNLCGAILEGDRCPKCGYELFEKVIYENLDTGEVRFSHKGKGHKPKEPASNGAKAE